MSDTEGPKPMEFVRVEEPAPAPTGRVAAVRIDEAGLATLVREEPPLPPLYQFLLKLADQMGDIVGCALFTFLCLRDKMTGDTAAMCMLAVLGVNNGVRVLGGRARDAAGNLRPPPGLGAIALGLGFLGTLAGHVFRSHTGTSSGFAQLRVLRAVALGVVCCVALALVGCAGQGDSMQQLVGGYGSVRTWAQRICGVVAMLPPPPTPSAPPLDAGVP